MSCALAPWSPPFPTRAPDTLHLVMPKQAADFLTPPATRIPQNLPLLSGCQVTRSPRLGWGRGCQSCPSHRWRALAPTPGPFLRTVGCMAGLVLWAVPQEGRDHSVLSRSFHLHEGDERGVRGPGVLWPRKSEPDSRGGAVRFCGTAWCRGNTGCC